ncbi:MAG: DUF348 domain-containing protein [Anaerolineae bacterium]|nr:DUF348 domain-containing protein [Anaerolineae bacterium]
MAAIRCGRRGWVFISLLLVGALLASYNLNNLLAQKSIRVTMGSEVYRFKTQADTVGAALDEAGVLIDPEDHVSPNPTAPLHDGDTITVQKARLIAISADGTVQQVRTQATHPLDVLNNQQITIAPHDLIRVDGQTYAVAALQDRAWNTPFQTLVVLRSVPIMLIDRSADDKTDSEQVQTLYTTQSDVGQALDEADITLYLADRITPDLSAPIVAGMVIEIDRSVPVTVIADGRTLDTRAVGPTVGDALAYLGLAPIDQDITIPSEDSPLEADMVIRLVRVTEDIVTETEPIPYSTDAQFEAGITCDDPIEIQPGVDGELEHHIRVRYEDGIETERQIISEQVNRQPVPRVISCPEKVS